MFKNKMYVLNCINDNIFLVWDGLFLKEIISCVYDGFFWFIN